MGSRKVSVAVADAGPLIHLNEIGCFSHSQVIGEQNGNPHLSAKIQTFALASVQIVQAILSYELGDIFLRQTMLLNVTQSQGISL